MDEVASTSLYLDWAYLSLRRRWGLSTADASSVLASEMRQRALAPPPDPTPAPAADATVWSGAEWGLSVRESEVIVLLAEGCSNPEIAARTFLSVNSVKTYLRTAYRKMGVGTRTRAVLWAVDHGARPGRGGGGGVSAAATARQATVDVDPVGQARLRPVGRALGDRDARILLWCDPPASGVIAGLDA